MMNIIISPEVKDFIRARGSRTITIYPKLLTSCWSPREEIFVKLREPGVPEDYNKHEVEGLEVYLYKDAIVVGDSIEINLSKKGSDIAGQELQVEGLDI